MQFVSKPTAILVLRADDEFSQMLRGSGLEVFNLPLIKTEPLEDQSELHRCIAKIHEYDGLFFTSPVSAEIFGCEIGESRNAIRGKLYTMGTRAKWVLEEAGLPAFFDPSVNTAEELITSRSDDEFRGKKFLFLRGDRSILTIPNLLKEKAVVDEVVVYRTIGCRPAEADIIKTANSLRSGDFDWLCFFSPSAVEVFQDTFGTSDRTKTATIGRTTAGRAEELGFDVSFISPRSSAIDFAQAFVSHLNGK
jgi:uroporphyrinogen III methyltransferase/synthase